MVIRSTGVNDTTKWDQKPGGKSLWIPNLSGASFYILGPHSTKLSSVPWGSKASQDIPILMMTSFALGMESPVGKRQHGDLGSKLLLKTRNFPRVQKGRGGLKGCERLDKGKGEWVPSQWGYGAGNSMSPENRGGPEPCTVSWRSGKRQLWVPHKSGPAIIAKAWL